MKALIYGLYGVFFFLMGTTFYVAADVYDGLVDTNYYESARDYFESSRMEEALGLEVAVEGERLKRGRNGFSVRISAGGRPLSGADVRLFVGNISTTGYDRTYPLVEGAAGVYSADVEIPVSGRWLLNLGIEDRRIRTGKKWFITVD
ncbi:MAG TPA: hypothetical protein ENJ04_04510 [Nitrospirae bacterium]|nr:hypothetical protein [Nitrospirota bacterium]